MKKILFSVLSLFMVSVSSFAQDANAGDFNIGITVGGGLAKINADDPTYPGFTSERKPIANIQGGLVFDITFVNGFFAEAGLTFQRKGGKQEIETKSYKSTVTTNLYYMELPLTLNFRIPVGDLGLIPQAGAYVAYGVGGKTKSTTEYNFDEATNVLGDLTGELSDYDPSVKVYTDASSLNQKTEETEGDSFGDGAADKLDYGLRFGLGLAFTEKVKLAFGYDLGLVDIVRGDNSNFKNRNGVLFGTLTFYVK
ncbi:MAG: PorT family protein [Paludibacteraceae bacterium]|nr:PorT family protein [Paludibacteraceae bacterium]